jgi:two-component system chemotaxis response regulator CheY
MMVKKKKHILIVDDDASVHTLSHLFLKTLPYVDSISSVYNGQEGIEFLKHHCEKVKTTPDVILLDYQMPIMNGLQFLRRLKALSCFQLKPPKVVMISSVVDPIIIHCASALGVHHFFSKPLRADYLPAIFED